MAKTPKPAPAPAQKKIVMELSEDDQLQPCPFCGASDALRLIPTQAFYKIECGCGASIAGPLLSPTADEDDHLQAATAAIAKWNTRPPQTFNDEVTNGERTPLPALQEPSI